MKLSSRLAGGLAVACTLALTIVGCGGGGRGSSATDDSAAAAAYTLVEDGKIIVASDLANPPLDYVEEGPTEAVGFEVDLMGAVAEKLGLECEYLPAMKFDSIIPLIQQGGRADVGVSNFTITDERAELIDFSTPYLDSNLGIVTRVDSARTTEDALDAEGVTVAVQSGSTGAAWAEENLPNATIVSLDDPVVSVTGVSAGQYDAAVADLPVMQYLANSYDNCQVSIEIPTGEQYGIVVSKDNPGLTQAIDDALAELEEEGTISELEQEWFGTEL